ncbi:MAG: LysR family transcriptional regulator [Pseudomonadota bacterium]
MDDFRPGSTHLPDLNSLQLFLRAVDSGSLSKAAQQSHIALSAASRRIGMLEDQLGVRLLTRTPAGVEPTPAGVATAEHARQLLRGVDHLRAEVADYGKGAKGHVRLHANTSVMGQELPDLVAGFLAKHPDIRIDIREQRSGAIAQALRDGLADVGVVVAGVPLDGLDAHPYRFDTLVAIVPQRHPLKGRSARFTTLLDHDLVGLDDSAAITRLMASAAGSCDKPLRMRVQAQSFEAVCRMVAAGLGIGILPEGAVRTYKRDMDLRFIAIAEDWAARQMFICTRAGKVAQPARTLVRHLLAGAG